MSLSLIKSYVCTADSFLCDSVNTSGNLCANILLINTSVFVKEETIHLTENS